VVALADAFDAMTSDRPYRKGMEPEAAFAEIEKQAGRQFDPRFAAAFTEMRETIMKEMRELQEYARQDARRQRVLVTS
jgi:HD-GYP domain-containing protein (c-di-GMP phosphodiesterase class II)